MEVTIYYTARDTTQHLLIHYKIWTQRRHRSFLLYTFAISTYATSWKDLVVI